MTACVDCHRYAPSDHYAAEVRATHDHCAKVRCMACGELRCHGEGTGNGRCKACFYGRLPGWSFSYVPSVCQYSGCQEPAVYSDLPGSKKHCCKKHGDTIIARRKQASRT